MARGISLRRYEEQKLFAGDRRGYSFRVVIEAYDADMMPEEIFGHQQTTLDPYKGVTGEDFCFVCAPDDLVKYPVGEPNPVQQPQFYRKNRIDVLVPTREMALEMWLEIEQQVCALVEALDRKDRLILAETTRCGDPNVEQSISQSVSVSA